MVTLLIQRRVRPALLSFRPEQCVAEKSQPPNHPAHSRSLGCARDNCEGFLFSDAEFFEDDGEDVVGQDFSADGTEVIEGFTEVDGQEFGVAIVGLG
jgi:hypothetical protein